MYSRIYYYDPFEIENPRNYGNPYEQRRRQELARRQRIAEAERCRQVEVERRHEARRQFMREKQVIEKYLQRMAESEREREYEEELYRRRIALVRRQRGESDKADERLRSVREPALPREDPSSHPPGKIVRGVDGKLYKIDAPPGYRYRSKPPRNVLFDTIKYAATEEKIVGDDSSGGGKNIEKDLMLEKLDGYRGSSDGRVSMAGAKHLPVTQLRTKRTRSVSEPFHAAEVCFPMPKAVYAIPVEDVPDNEDDELRELHSIWRNRVPRPGQWIEPVDVM